ncbi:MAG TPA: hypothetical protein VME43_10350 [Bryobacteraceae bacterium]|nr:hypothetical protein [Bryobacteraceae bacterium]
MVLGVAIFAVVLFWLASRQKPLYRKMYFETRGDGAFRTEFVPGFKDYLEHLEKEVGARFTVGPFSPTDDMLASLYHPELEVNWRRELLPRSRNWMLATLKVTGATVVCLSIAVLMTGILNRNYELLGALFDVGDAPKKLVAWGFSIAIYACAQRTMGSINRTQGYLDGYSDRCAGLKHCLRIFRAPGE